MLKAILFDIDDTLLSFQGFVKEAMREGFRHFGLAEYREEMYGVFTRINRELWQRLERGEMSFEELKAVRWNKIFEALGLQADGVAFEEYFRDALFDNAICENGAVALLEALKGRYILCAASNGPYLQQVNRLKVGGLLPYFDHLFISEEMGISKPSPDFFRLCLERLNRGRADAIEREEVLIIGDSLSSDIKGGLGAGIHTLFYNPAGTIPPEGCTPEYTVSSLEEILTVL